MRGRPSFKPTAAQRRRCEILAAARMSEADIAVAIGISVPTLRKHFAQELHDGKVRRNAKMLEAMYRTGLKGNVSAQKAWLDRQGIEPDAAGGRPANDGAAPAVDGKLGKKEIAQRQAQTAEAGTSWDGILKH